MHYGQPIFSFAKKNYLEHFEMPAVLIPIMAYFCLPVCFLFSCSFLLVILFVCLFNTAGLFLFSKEFIGTFSNMESRSAVLYDSPICLYGKLLTRTRITKISTKNCGSRYKQTKTSTTIIRLFAFMPSC